MIIVDTGIIIETDEIKAKGIVDTMKLPFSRMDDVLRISKRVAYDIYSRRAVNIMLNSHAKDHKPFPICNVDGAYTKIASLSYDTSSPEVKTKRVMRVLPLREEQIGLMKEMKYTNDAAMEARKLIGEMSLRALSAVDGVTAQPYIYHIYFNSDNIVHIIECFASGIPHEVHEIGVVTDYREDISIQNIMDISRQLYDIADGGRSLIRKLGQGTFRGKECPNNIMAICRADGKPFEAELIHKIQMIADQVFKYKVAISKGMNDISWL